jgi:hypothetical protein
LAKSRLGGTLVSVRADQAPMELTIALHRGSTIAGVVTNDLKEPVVGAQVRATSRQSRGDVRWLATETAKTDDHGAYRVIGLDAGQYFVSATDGLSVAFASGARSPGFPGRLRSAWIANRRTSIFRPGHRPPEQSRGRSRDLARALET